MQLDKTHVAIRTRSLSEIGDLSLLMIRRYPQAFFQAFFLGALPWIVLNAGLLSWIVWQFPADESFDDNDFAEWWRYVAWMATLVIVQTPLAGALSTYYLGQAIFEQQPTLARTLGKVRRHAWPLTWTLGINRWAILILLPPLLKWGVAFDPFTDAVVPITVLIFVAFFRGSRPFVPEMVLLEQCPLRDKNPDAITLRRRSKALHAPIASELGSRFLTVSVVYFALLGSVYYTLVFVRGITLGQWSNDAFAMIVFYPLSLWLIASLSVIVRLLGYLDTRIRLEGWEVELAIRAEAIRQFGDDDMSSPKKLSSPGIDAVGGAGKRRVAGVVASVAVLILTLNPAAAQEPVEPPPLVSDSAWYDATAEEMRSVKLVPQTPDATHRDSRWTPRPPVKNPTAGTPGETKVSDWLIWPWNWTWPWNWSWSIIPWAKLIGWLLVISLLVSLAIAIVWLFKNMEFEFSNSQRIERLAAGAVGVDEQTQQRIKELPAELRAASGNPRQRAEAAMAAGDFETAILFLFSHQLLLLDRVGWLRLSRGKTNRGYVIETRSQHPNAATTLRRTADAFERSYFGRHATTRDAFERLWNDNAELESVVAGAVGKAA